MAERSSTLLESVELEFFPQPPVINLNYPVLLCHGYGALASLFKPAPLHDVSLLLRKHGILAFAPNVEPYARIEPRARNWCALINEILERTESEKLNVLAHSMGGLDIRYAISTLGMHEQISSLVTVATPHRGTALAELAQHTPSAVKSGIGAFFDWLGDYLYPDSESDFLGPLEQLTCSYMENIFNPQNPDHDQIYYYSYSSAVGKGTDTPCGSLLGFQNKYIFEHEGLNDGFVSVNSAKWGAHQKTFALTHLEQMKFGMEDDRVPLWKECWLDIARLLSEKGH